MDFTLLRAGRTTHLKIVTVALVAAIAVVTVGLNARIHRETANAEAKSGVIKAGEPATYAHQEFPAIR